MKCQQTVVRMIGRLTGMKECVSATGRPGQTASEHCLRQWGMKPTVLNRRDPQVFDGLETAIDSAHVRGYTRPCQAWDASYRICRRR